MAESANRSDEKAGVLARLTSFPEQNPDPVIEVDLEGTVTYLNPVAEARFPDLQKKGLSHAVLEDFPSVIESLKDGDEEAFVRELEIGEFSYEQKITFVAGKNLVRIFAHDLTERKRAEAAVRESEARFHSIFEHSNDAIFLIDITADEILDANSKACRMLGYEREELLSLSVSTIHPDEMPKLEAFLKSVVAEGQGWTDELTCLTKKGQTLSAEISASTAEIGGRSCMIAVVRDVTERRRAEILLADEVQARYNFEEIIGQSTSLEEALKQVELVAPTDTSVLILGETGTGKEVICRAIHHSSPRNKKPLVKLNVAAIPSGLIESELFGHEKGAFTGAISQKQGRFELAHEGSIFLDEIGDLPLETQPKLLRLLQEQEFERVGGTRTIKVDIRVIAATHRNLEQMVRDGEFREDLFYRLNVFPISLPPLRDRREDIPVLANYFDNRICARFGRPPCGFNKEALDQLLEYRWPGNVRELENIVERAIILCRGEAIGREHVKVESVSAAGAHQEGDIELKPLQEVERDYIVAALRTCEGKVSGKDGAADRLGLKPSTLESRMKKLGISREDL